MDNSSVIRGLVETEQEEVHGGASCTHDRGESENPAFPDCNRQLYRIRLSTFATLVYKRAARCVLCEL